MAAGRPIRPADGGQLITTASKDTVGMTNYVQKVNMRRVMDCEERREGWIRFRPNDSLPQGTQSLDVSDKVTLVAENIRPNSERCVIAATATTIYRYAYTSGTWSVIGSGYSANARRWQSSVLNGYIVLNNGVDLPVSYRVEDSSVTPLRELREVGYASVEVIVEFNGFLMCLNVREIKASELAGIMNSSSPYGRVDDESKVNHIPYRVIWPVFADPTNWSPLFTATMGAASATITLPFPSSAFVPGVTRVAVINGGPNDGVLGGDEAHPDGILVTAVSGNNITLEIPTATGISYPRKVQVTRWSDISTLAGRYDLQGNASHITWGKVLGGRTLVIYRTRGINCGRYTGDASAPFEFPERYGGSSGTSSGYNVPKWGEAVADVNGDYHLYPGEGGRFYAFDGVSVPEIHPLTDACRNELFDDLTPLSDVWAVDNPITKEVWFCRPGRTLAYCYERGVESMSVIDAEIHAAALVARPGWEDQWFTLAIGGRLFTYGLVKVSQKPTILTYLRDGVDPGATIQFGLWDLGDALNEKRLGRYVLLTGSGQRPLPVQLKLASTYSASADAVECLAELIPDVTEDGGLIPLGGYFDTYFQDTISLPGSDGDPAGPAADRNFRFVGRIITAARVNSGGVARNNA